MIEVAYQAASLHFCSCWLFVECDGVEPGGIQFVIIVSQNFFGSFEYSEILDFYVLILAKVEVEGR